MAGVDAAALVASLTPETRAILANALSSGTLGGLTASAVQAQAAQQAARNATAQPQQHYPSRPPNMVPVPGLTDRRFEGVIQTFRQDKGFGFIKCAELKVLFPDKDVFLHNKQLSNYQEGSAVSFSVSLNKQGKPQAMELGPPGQGSTMPVTSSLVLPAIAPAPAPAPAPPPAPTMAGQGMVVAPPSHVVHAACAGAGGGMLASAGPAANADQVMTMEAAAAALAASAAAAAGAPAAGPMAVYEVEVPKDFLVKVVGERGEGLSELKQRAGGNITISFQDRPNQPQHKVALFQGPEVSASLGACLMLDKISELLWD